MAFGAEPVLDGTEMLFLLLEVVDVGKDGTYQDNEEEKQKVYGIDGNLLKRYNCEVL